MKRPAGYAPAFLAGFRRRLPLVATLVLTAVLVGGCGGGSSNSGSTSSGGRGGTLTVVSTGPPDSIDPALAYSNLAWGFLNATNDGLVAFRKTSGEAGTQIVPDLSTNVPTPTSGGKVYTFHLRNGVTYSNGAPVRASDFRNAIQRLFKAQSPSPYFSDIVGASACAAKPATCNLSQGIVTDDSTGEISIHLTQPNGELLDQLALPFADLVPPSVPNKDVGVHAAPATGPYMIQSYVPNVSLTLVRNPHFTVWSTAAQPAGYPSKIVYKFDVNAESEVNEVLSGQADWAYDNPPADRLGDLATNHAKLMHFEPNSTTWWFFLNTLQPPFNNLQARQAFNYAVDRGAVVKLFGGSGVASPTCQLLSPLIVGYKAYCPYTSGSTSSGKWSAPDMSKAKQLVAASGTKGDPVSVYTETDEPARSVGIYIQSVLQSLGYKPTLKPLSTSVYYNVAPNSATKANTGWFEWIPDYPSPGQAFIVPTFSCASRRLNSSANLNASQYCNPALDKKIAQALSVETSQGVQASAPMWTAIDHTLTDQAALLPLVNAKRIILLSDRVKNLVYSPAFFPLISQFQVQ